MKIDEMSQAAVGFVNNVRVEKQWEYQGESSSRHQPATDKVDFSRKIPAAPESEKREALRANRVEEIKAQLESGTYEVSAQAVAEKIMSKVEKLTLN